MKHTGLLLFFSFICVCVLLPGSAYAQNLDAQVHGGAQGVEVARYRVYSGLEDMEIQRFRVYNDVDGTDAAINTLELHVDGQKVATSFLSARYATFDGLGIVIPRDKDKVLVVKANFNSGAALAGIGGASPRIIFRNFMDWNGRGDIRIVGMQSGYTYESLGGNQFGGNTMTRTLYVYNSVPALRVSPTSPRGFRGAAFGNEMDLWEFEVTAGANSSALSPREIVISEIYFTISGDAEVTDIYVLGPGDNYQQPIAHFPQNHIVSPSFNAATTVIPVSFTTDARIAYGTSRKYRIRGKVNAPTDSNNPSRSISISIQNYGTSGSPGDFRWYDNGLPVDNPETQLVNWLYDPSGMNRLETMPPLSFGSGVMITPVFQAPEIQHVPADIAPTDAPVASQVPPQPIASAPMPPGPEFTKPIIPRPTDAYIRRARLLLLAPRSRATTEEFLRMFVRVFNLPENMPYAYADVNDGSPLASYAGAAAVYELFPLRRASIQPQKPVTRAEALRAIAQYLKNRE